MRCGASPDRTRSDPSERTGLPAREGRFLFLAPRAIVSVMHTLSPAEARAIALRAQGFGKAWNRRDPISLLDHLGAIQLDSVNVIARSHELVPFSRMGPFSVERMRKSVYAGRRGFE